MFLQTIPTVWSIEPLMPPIVAAEPPKGLPDLQRCREMHKPFGLTPEENFGTPFQNIPNTT